MLDVRIQGHALHTAGRPGLQPRSRAPDTACAARPPALRPCPAGCAADIAGAPGFAVVLDLG